MHLPYDFSIRTPPRVRHGRGQVSVTSVQWWRHCIMYTARYEIIPGAMPTTNGMIGTAMGPVHDTEQELTARYRTSSTSSLGMVTP